MTHYSEHLQVMVFEQNTDTLQLPVQGGFFCLLAICLFLFCGSIARMENRYKETGR